MLSDRMKEYHNQLLRDGIIGVIQHTVMGGLVTEVAALEAELQVVRAMLGTAYHLRFVDDTSTHEEQMQFWTDVEEKIRDE